MKKLRGPLFSLGATGRLARAYTLARRLTGPAWLLRGRPDDPRTEPQLSWRTMWQLAASLWHELSEAEVREWERAGTIRHMTGFAWYMSQALRPNPGIYLPLAGGDMSGVIDMQGNHIHGLDTPVHISDAANKQYVDWKVREEVTRPGARVRRTSDQAIPTGDATLVTLDTEDYDNDNLWDAGSPGLLTIRTAGIYLVIGQIHWEGPDLAGYRITYIRHSAAGIIAQSIVFHSDDTMRPFSQTVSTWDCAVGENFHMEVYQDTGGPLNIRAEGNQAPTLQAVRIG
ncbi:hypothetical protein ES708_14393 [subsurface metagenome]